MDVYFAEYGTAAEGSDYTLPESTVHFDADQTAATLAVHVLNDHVADGDKRLTLVLESEPAEPYTLDTLADMATLTIHDGAPTVTIDDAAPVPEGDTAEFHVDALPGGGVRCYGRRAAGGGQRGRRF